MNRPVFCVVGVLCIMFLLCGCAEKEPDFESCLEKTDSESRGECYAKLASIYRDLGICEHLSSYELVYRCYVEAAHGIDNAKMCDSIDDDEYARWCRSWIEKDPLPCSEILRNDIKDCCYCSVAASRLDEIFCERVNEPSSRDACFREMALLKNDAGICKKVVLQSGRDECLLKVALKTRDIELCLDITDRLTKDECYSWISSR